MLAYGEFAAATVAAGDVDGVAALGAHALEDWLALARGPPGCDVGSAIDRRGRRSTLDPLAYVILPSSFILVLKDIDAQNATNSHTPVATNSHRNNAN